MEILSLWGVEVEGDADDLRNMEEKINGSIQSLDDLFVARLDDLFVLRSRLWDHAPDPQTAKELAANDLKMVRSCLDLLDGCGALEVGTIFYWQPDGTIDQTRDTKFTVRIKKRHTDWATPQQFHELLMGAQTQVHLGDALRGHSWSADWYDIYKSLEALKHHYGDEKRLLRAFPAEESEIVRLKRTANTHRHTRRAFAPINNPMTLADAQRLLVTLLNASAVAAAKKARPRNALMPETKINLKHYQKSDGGKFGLKKLQLAPGSGPDRSQRDLVNPRRISDD